MSKHTSDPMTFCHRLDTIINPAAKVVNKNPTAAETATSGNSMNSSTKTLLNNNESARFTIKSDGNVLRFALKAKMKVRENSEKINEMTARTSNGL